MRTQRFSSGFQIRLETKLGLKRRLLLLLAWETVCPERGRLPVMGQSLDMVAAPFSRLKTGIPSPGQT